MNDESTPVIDARTFRATMGRFATGVTVVTTGQQGSVYGMTANAFVSVSLAPPLVLVSVDNRAKISQHLAADTRYGVNILSEKQEDLSRHFGGRPQEGIHIPFVWHDWHADAGWLCGAHRRAGGGYPPSRRPHLYIGHVEYLKWWEKRPLLFYAGQYDQLTVTHNLPDEMAWFAPSR